MNSLDTLTVRKNNDLCLASWLYVLSWCKWCLRLRFEWDLSEDWAKFEWRGAIYLPDISRDSACSRVNGYERWNVWMFRMTSIIAYEANISASPWLICFYMLYKRPTPALFLCLSFSHEEGCLLRGIPRVLINAQANIWNWVTRYYI